MKKLHPTYTILLFAICAILFIFNHHRWTANKVLDYDVLGYHNYLPATFIYKDITKYKYMDSIEPRYKATMATNKKYGLHLCPKDSNLCNQYPMGVAVFEAPLFILAHWYTSSKHPQIADGYSKAYQYCVVMSTYLFALLGLVFLSKFLKKFYTPTTIFFTIIVLVFGTNYFHYATLEAGNAHIYLFFLYAVVLHTTVQWYQKVTWANSIAIGICIGLAIITRPIDIFICLIPLCWQPANTAKFVYWQQHSKYIMAIIVCAFIACIPQLLYWKHVTGHWVYYSYSSVDYFEWTRLRIWQGLFGYRKGWFVYTPIALIAFIQMIVGKLPTALQFYKHLFWVYFIPMLYIVFSWHNWFYGWGFSCRALIGVLPLLAIPLAVFIQNVLQSSGIKKNIFTTVLITLVAYNAFQTWQYEHGIINGTLMNKTTYWKIFLQTKRPQGIDADFKLQDELDWKNGY